jgi:hypothetical protein
MVADFTVVEQVAPDGAFCFRWHAMVAAATPVAVCELELRTQITGGRYSPTAYELTCEFCVAISWAVERV